jgi:hypothetical protein
MYTSAPEAEGVSTHSHRLLILIYWWYDRSRHTAMRAAGLLARLAADGHPVDRTGTGVIVEVYRGLASAVAAAVPGLQESEAPHRAR